jgi:hypothetical protein
MKFMPVIEIIIYIDLNHLRRLKNASKKCNVSTKKHRRDISLYSEGRVLGEFAKVIS